MEPNERPKNAKHYLGHKKIGNTRDHAARSVAGRRASVAGLAVPTFIVQSET
jgi:hypothetical protein